MKHVIENVIILAFRSSKIHTCPLQFTHYSINVVLVTLQLHINKLY